MRLTGSWGVRTLRTLGGKYQTLPITLSHGRVSVKKVRSAQTAQPSIHKGSRPMADSPVKKQPLTYVNLFTRNHHRQGVSE